MATKAKRAAATNGQAESSSESPPAKSVGRWRCEGKDCGHAWSAHSGVT